MKCLARTFTIIFFFAWLLPLGVFITPSQEKIACGGKRAICLCSHKPDQGKVAHEATQTPSYQSGASQAHELASGTFHPFESFAFNLNVVAKSAALNPYRFHYFFRSNHRIDHVPKIA